MERPIPLTSTDISGASLAVAAAPGALYNFLIFEGPWLFICFLAGDETKKSCNYLSLRNIKNGQTLYLGPNNGLNNGYNSSSKSVTFDGYPCTWSKEAEIWIYDPKCVVFMPTAILTEAYCFCRVLKNLAFFKMCFLGFLYLKILHRTQIRWPQIFCLYLSVSLYISVMGARS